MDELRRHFGLRPQDALFLIPEVHGASADEEWDRWTPEQRAQLDIQIKLNVQSQLQHVRGFNPMGGFVLPPGYEFLAEQCARLFEDHPSYERNVFIMTRLMPGNRLLVELDQQLRLALRERNLNPVRADDKMYMPDRNLWNNVCVYMLCCAQGIAVLEDRVSDEFNPNVALEYGFMRALNRRTLLLADSGFRNLRADVIGTLRETFDITDIGGTIRDPVHRWCMEIGH